MVDEYVPADMKEKVLADWAHVRGNADVDLPNNGDNDKGEIQFNTTCGSDRVR